MSEQLLRVIIHLLAIVAKEDDVTEDERNAIQDFLLENLNYKECAKFMSLFDQMASTMSGERAVSFSEEKEIGLLAKQVNQELSQQQKLVVLLKVIELIVADGEVSDREATLLTVIGQSLNFSEDEIQRIKGFVVHKDERFLNAENILLITQNKGILGDTQSKHIQRKGLPGLIAFFRIPSLELYFVKYNGDEALTLNGVPLRKNKIVVFSAGSSIRGGKIDPVFYSDVVSSFRKEANDTRISFVAEDISFTFPNGHKGLRGINIAEPTGRLIGLMGGSGAGKSTLLNVLNGNENPSEGSVRINGIDIHKDKKNIEGIIGYVPQDDLLIEELTVYENLHYAAQLCFSKMSRAEINDLVEKTLAALGLTATRDLKVGSPLEKTISGGQRKRLNIGLELLREPSVMFVDEPTSGLSSRDSENIMDLLKELSLKGKMIFVVIHQPSSEIFRMFDKLVILDVGGYQIYYGNPVDGVVYFKQIVDLIDKDSGSCIECGNVNSEQIFNIIETKVVDEFGKFTDQRKTSPEEWNNHFTQKTEIPKIEEEATRPEKTLSIPGRIKQFAIFAKRDLASKVSNRQYLLINLLEAPLLAFILAFIIRYTDKGSGEYSFIDNPNIPAFFFMSIIVALFMGLTVSAEEIFKDRKILKRESFLNLSRWSYLISKMGILFTLSAIQTLLFVLIGDFIMGIKGMGPQFWLVLFSISCFANVLGLNISSAFNSAVTIYILIPLLIIPQLILSGVVVNFDKLHPWLSHSSKVPIIGELMASKWGYEALVVTQFKDNAYEKHFYDYDKALAEGEFKNLYLFPAIESSLESISKDYRSSNEETLDNVSREARKLYKTFRREMDYIGIPEDKFSAIDQFATGRLTNEAIEQAEKFVSVMNVVYNNRVKKASQLKEETIDQLKADLNGEGEFVTLRNDNVNESVEFFLKNTSTKNRLLATKDDLIQKIYPIFKDPSPTSPLDLRTHFFAPRKHFAGRFFETLHFNVAMIWLMSFVLIAALYYDWLRKLVNR